MSAIDAADAVDIVGTGELAAELRALTWPLPGAVTVLADPAQSLAALLVHQQRARDAGIAFLACRGIGTAIEVGPLVIAGRPGCLHCLDVRRRLAATAQGQPPVLATEPARWTLPGPWRSRVVSAVRQVLRVPALVRVIDPIAMTDEEHRPLPVPDCPYCDGRTDDRAETAIQDLTVRRRFRQSAPGSLRSGDGPQETALRGLVDTRFGPITAVRPIDASPVAFVSLDLAAGHPVRAYGRADTPAEARRLGLLEAVERDSAARPNARRTAVFGSYAELADRAVDPVTLGLPDPDLACRPRFGLVPYRPELVLPWVWASELGTGLPVLVPECMAYYASTAGPRIVSETSTGAAAGNCVPEALVHGCLEVIERDAFLSSWYLRDPGQRIDVAQVRDPGTRELLSRIRALGCEPRLHLLTRSVGPPVVWAFAVGADRAPLAFLSSAGAHLDGQCAIGAAVLELATLLELWTHRPPVDARRQELLVDAPDLVASIGDHVARWAHPRLRAELDWLLDGGGEPIAPEHAFAGADDRWRDQDLTEVLHGLVTRMAGGGMRPLAVSLTTPRDAALGLAVVKVLAPGAVPLSVGGLHHRTFGLPRLRPALPVSPHPFP